MRVSVENCGGSRGEAGFGGCGEVVGLALSLGWKGVGGDDVCRWGMYLCCGLGHDLMLLDVPRGPFL